MHNSTVLNCFSSALGSETEGRILWDRAWKALGLAAQKQAAHQKANEPAARFVELLKSAISSGHAHLAGSDGCAPGNPAAWGWRDNEASTNGLTYRTWRPQGDRVGWVNGEDVFLDPDASYRAAQAVAGAGGDGLSVSARTLRKRMDEKGLLIKEKHKDTLTVRRVMEGATRNVLYLAKDTDGAPSKVRQYYRAADIFVSLADNIQETFGLTVTQAMACGLPTIVSDWDGYKETVVHGETGVRICTYWAECDQQISALGRQRDWLADHLMLAQSVAVDMEDLLEALYFMATRPDLRHRLGEAGRRRAEKLYAWPVVIRQYRDLWDECHDRFEHLDLQAWTREEDEGILMPAYFQQFSHYASEIIAGDTQLTLMPEKLGVISRSGPADNSLLPPMMKTVLHPAVFESLMSHLSDWPVAFGTLVDVTARETGHSQDQVARQIMWLIKYGAVKPIRAIPNAHSVSRELVSI